jgi:hypothetical protein
MNPSAKARTTQALLPADEAPLDAATRDAFVASLGAGMVLVGGQALAFWMDRYGLTPQTPAITNDGDALGDLTLAQRMAVRLRASLITPQAHERTSLVAQVRVPTRSPDRVHNIDVLHLLYTVSGLRKSAEFTQAVRRDSVQIEWRPGQRIRVMHPLHVLDSRVQNAAGLLDSKGPHVVTQAIWAVDVAREAMRRVLKESSSQKQPSGRLGAMLSQVHALARSRAGRQVLREHGIEVLDAVPTQEIRSTAPIHEPQLLAIERSAALRAAAAMAR